MKREINFQAGEGDRIFREDGFCREDFNMPESLNLDDYIIEDRHNSLTIDYKSLWEEI